MFGLVKQSKVERLQAELVSERIDKGHLLDKVTELEKANKVLRDSNLVLFQKTPAARKRDAKGHFLPK